MALLEQKIPIMLVINLLKSEEQELRVCNVYIISHLRAAT